ncbi:MAG: small heat shock protein IbpA [Bacteroidota bacterium]|jgi:molecular chaperone IbpA
MVTQFAMDLFRDPFFIGFNRELDRLSNIYREATHQSYPPYNLVKIDDDTYQLSLALAGFSKDEVSVSVDNGSLIVKGEKAEESSKEVLHKGIATRKFTRTFALGEYMEVDRAEMADGILNIFVERNIPEEKKPKTIKIK